mmetsp:Transcript_55390/g.159260  ORF Transcript_55390/g.159260 Transcript_55390/m.159260 type:complete len:263 (-) Transcript_55390:111-899(-)
MFKNLLHRPLSVQVHVYCLGPRLCNASAHKNTHGRLQRWPGLASTSRSKLGGELGCFAFDPRRHLCEQSVAFLVPVEFLALAQPLLKLRICRQVDPVDAEETCVFVQALADLAIARQIGDGGSLAAEPRAAREKSLDGAEDASGACDFLPVRVTHLLRQGHIGPHDRREQSDGDPACVRVVPIHVLVDASAHFRILGVEFPLELVAEVAHDRVALVEHKTVLLDQARHRPDGVLSPVFLGLRVLPRHDLDLLDDRALVCTSP